MPEVHNEPNSKFESWKTEREKSDKFSRELLDVLYAMYENGCLEQLKSGLGAIGFDRLDKYVAQRKVERAALEEWIHA